MSNNNHPNNITNPSVTTSWNWQDYLYYLSLNGLHQTQYFNSNFPSSPIISDAYNLFLQYCDYGHMNLDYNLNP